MTKKKLLLGLLPLLLASCNEGPAALSEYIVPLPLFQGKETVNVLHITDLHWSAGTDVIREKDYFDSLFEGAKPDLVVTTGDNVLLGSPKLIDAQLSILDELAKKYDFHFMTTFGNHDRQGSFHPDYWIEAFAKTERGIYRQLKGIYGKSNYVVALTDGSNNPLWNVFALDSNTYRQTGMSYEYDVIHEDQIQWYEDIETMSNDAPNLVYCHIPLYETEYAFRLAGEAGAKLEDNTGRPGVSAPGKIGRYSGTMDEKDVVKNEELGPSRCAVGYERTRMFEAMEAHEGRGVFFGHDHVNDFCAEYTLNEEGTPKITIGYGLKTGDGLYYDAKMMGGTLATLQKDGSVEYFRCFQGYGENSFRKEAMFQ